MTEKLKNFIEAAVKNNEMLKKLKDYSRFLELEDSIPYWESLMPELENRIEELKWNKQQKELEMLQLKEPNFFQRLFGRAEEKKEKLSKQIREITSARTAAQWELESLKKQTLPSIFQKLNLI